MKRLFLSLALLWPLVAGARIWTTIYEPFDSLADLCERYALVRAPHQKEYSHWIDAMDSIAHSRRDRRLKWRTLHRKALYTFERDNDRALDYVDSALCMVDTAAYPYDYHRLLWARHTIARRTDLQAVYYFIKRELPYYRRIGDKRMVATFYTNIGNAYLRLGMIPEGLDYYRKASALYSDIGLDDERLYAEKLIISYYVLAGDTATARRIFNEAIRAAAARSDTVEMIYVHSNAVLLDLEHLTEAWRLAVKSRNEALTGLTSVSLAEKNFDEGRPLEALMLLRDAAGRLDPRQFNYHEFLSMSARLRAECFERLEMADSAWYWHRRYREIQDSIGESNRIARFQGLYDDIMAREQYARLEELESDSGRSTLLTLLGLSTVLVVVGGATLWLNLRWRSREKESRALSEAIEVERELGSHYRAINENNRRNLDLSSSRLREEDEAIDSLRRRIESGDMADGLSREFSNLLRVHQGGQEDLRRFNEYFNRFDPEYYGRLRERFPALTQGDLRLCCLLRMGLDRRTIASMLSIQPVAVKQARYRLRAKLGLPTAASLDDFLRTL